MGGSSSSVLKQTVGVVAAPFTGGLSLGLTAKEMKKNRLKKIGDAKKYESSLIEKARVSDLKLEEQKRKQQLSNYYGNYADSSMSTTSPFKTLLGQ